MRNRLTVRSAAALTFKFSERLAIDSDCHHHFGSGAKRKIHWSNFSHETINVKYVTPLLVDLTDFEMSESNDTETVTKTITNLLLKHSYSLSSPGSNRNRKRKHGVYVRLPDDVKVARSQCKIAFDFWKQDNFLSIALCMITIGQNTKIIVWLCVTS